MERTSNALLLALFALPHPPDCRLIDTHVGAAIEEQDDGAAARGALGEEAASLARVSPCLDTIPVGRGEGGAAGHGLQRFYGDEATCVDAIQVGRGEGGAAGHGLVRFSGSGDGAARRGIKGDGGARHLNATRGRRGKDDGGASGAGPERSMGMHHLDVARSKQYAARKQWEMGASVGTLESSTLDVVACGRHAEEGLGGFSGSSMESSRNSKHSTTLETGRRQPTALMGIAKTLSTISSVSDDDGCLFSPHAPEQPPCSSPTSCLVPDASMDVLLCSSGVDSKESYHNSINREGCAYVTTKTILSTSCTGEHSTRTAASVVADQAGMASHPSSTFTAADAQTSPSMYDPSYEILMCDGQVLSKPWKEIWEKNPLILHDMNLACFYFSQHELCDLTEVISSILQNHPGAAKYFRLDSSRWTGGRTQLSKWLKRLSEKSISEIIIVNQTYDIMLEFPLEDIESSSLVGLRLGFFSLSDLDLHCFEYGNLNTLELIGCTFDTHRLYHVVKDCKKLSHLGIGLSTRDIKLKSESLEHVQIWRCRMRSFTVEFCPRLHRVIIGVRPKEECVSVTVKGTPCLQEFEYMFLPVNKTEDPCWLSTLKKLILGIQLDSYSQRKLLCDYLKCASTLQELIISREDDVGPCEELDVAVDDSLRTLSSDLACSRTLMKFEIQNFRGGGAELAVARDVLKYALNLRRLSVCMCPDALKEKVGKAYKELQTMERVSSNCSLTISRPSI